MSMPLLVPTDRARTTVSRAPTSQADALVVAGGAQRTGTSEAIGPVTLLCASGRGGSGTTLVAALLAVAAAGDGYRVLLIDTDDLLGPLAMTLGVTPRATWQDLRGGRATPTDVATPVSATLTLVAGGPARRNSEGAPVVTLTAAERRASLRRLSVLSEGVDLVVIDCGSRLESVFAAIAPHSGETLIAIAAGVDPVGLASTYALCKAVSARHGALPVEILVNRQEGSDATRCFDLIDAGARQFLGYALHLAGAIPADATLDAALHKGMPFPDAAVGSPAAVAAHDIVTRALTARPRPRPLSRSGV